MLKPEYIDRIPDALVELYAEAERDILADMVRRISTYDFFIPAAEFQFRKLQDMGLLYDEILKKLSAMMGVTTEEIAKLMEEAGATALKADDSIYRKAGLAPTPLDSNVALQAILAAGIEKTGGLFQNLTRTTANTATKQFENALDRAYMQITTGAFDYNSAIRMAAKDLCSKGVAVIQYPSGHTDYMEVAVRRATVTGVNQTAAKLQDARADEMGSDLVEVTAHAGARTGVGVANHAEWQGKVYSRSGTHPKYPSLSEETGYGTGPGLCGWGCRHNFFPYIEGISERAYTQTELDDMNASKYTYNGQKMTEEEAMSRQRAIERTIRKWKREYVGMGAAGLPTEEAAAKIARWQRTQKDFLEQTGLKHQVDREQIPGYSKSQARKVSAKAKEIEKYSKIRYNEDGTVKVTDDWKVRKHPTVLKKYKSNAIVETVSKHGEHSQVDRSIYDETGSMKTQINSGAHGNPAMHPYGQHGEHAHDIIWKDGKIIDRPSRELTEKERKEHGDIL